MKRVVICLLFLSMLTAIVVAGRWGSTKTFIDITREKDVQKPQAHYYDYSLDDLVWYPVPPFARIKRVTFSQLRKGIFQVSIETWAPIPRKTTDMLSFAAYFTTPGAEGLCDIGIIYTPGNYRFAVAPPSPEGGVFRLYKELWIGKVQASVRGSTVTIRFPSRLVDDSKDFEMVVIRYLPGDLELSRVSGGVRHSIADVERHPRLADVQIFIPDHP